MKSCNQCGKCCVKYSNGGLSATDSEIKWWDSTRPDIYDYVRDGNIWMDPKSGKPLELCPWLRKQENNVYTCAIYYDRSDDCKSYPVTIEQMVSDECEMLEVSDLNNTKNAQKILDKIMSDSRPAFDTSDS